VIRAYPWIVVGILALANVSAHIDRQILSLLVAPIRRDLEISDTQMSLLQGLAFALFYMILGVPIGRLADTRSRRAIIGWGIAVWSLMTATCGIARTYTQLLLARVGVGIGEAALAPPAISLIADYFPRERLGLANGVYGIGVYFGSGLAYLLGGQVVQLVSDVRPWQVPLIGEMRPWQMVFLVVGLPGLMIALLMLLVREPARRGSTHAAPSPLALASVIEYLARQRRVYAALFFGYSASIMVNYGTAAWLPSFLSRVHGWEPGRIGLYMGGATMTFGVLGVLAGGKIGDVWTARGRADGKLRVGIVAAAGMLATTIPLYLTTSDALVIALLVPLNVFAAMPFGAATAALSEVTPNEMRAQMTALYFLVSSLVGFTLGPTAVAAATDYVFGSDQAVGRSLLLVSAVGLTAAAALLTAGLSSFRAALSDAQPPRPLPLATPP
jgi:MFS family permease